MTLYYLSEATSILLIEMQTIDDGWKLYLCVCLGKKAPLHRNPNKVREIIKYWKDCSARIMHLSNIGVCVTYGVCVFRAHDSLFNQNRCNNTINFQSQNIDTEWKRWGEAQKAKRSHCNHSIEHETYNLQSFIHGSRNDYNALSNSCTLNGVRIDLALRWQVYLSRLAALHSVFFFLSLCYYFVFSSSFFLNRIGNVEMRIFGEIWIENVSNQLQWISPINAANRLV